MKCDGSGWVITEAAREVCNGCDYCGGGWCERHHCYGNSCLMDHLEEAEERFMNAVCEGEEIDPEDAELLIDPFGKNKNHEQKEDRPAV